MPTYYELWLCFTILKYYKFSPNKEKLYIESHFFGKIRKVAQPQLEIDFVGQSSLYILNNLLID